MFELFKKYKSTEIVFFYFFLMNFEDEDVSFVKVLFFSIMKNKSIVTTLNFLIVFRMRVLFTIHFDDQNRNDSNFSKKKSWSNAIDKKIRIWRKKMLFANFVNFVSSNTLNEFKILMIIWNEIFQTMNNDNDISNDIRNVEWRRQNVDIKFFIESERIKFRTIRLKWKSDKNEISNDSIKMKKW